MARQFRITQDFFAEETKSQYVTGLIYTARSPELEKLAETWVKAGKAAWVKPVAGAATPAAVTGTGTVAPKGRR